MLMNHPMHIMLIGGNNLLKTKQIFNYGSDVEMAMITYTVYINRRYLGSDVSYVLSVTPIYKYF